MEDMKKDFDDVKKELQKEGLVKTFLSFDKMITPTLIKIIFYIGILLSTLTGLSMILSGMRSHFGGGIQVLLGLLTLVISPIVVRVYCELLIVIFKIHDSLNEIKNK
ncbi:DUF4282 domain-containing protein [Fusibacter sp. 3D3]|uniref:DUF4282 domain-containing protein n=1 Tax=Fusibacter sp. 3D3 TaxID=1048380 RepID=UPI000858AF68|nr:DUF4282 domain-containing protein [Fusibacter sp. 3D3]GAU75681.1 hypothetical membrane protein [Fusibacter sp. 3D3]